MISRLVHHFKQDDTEYKMHHTSNQNTKYTMKANEFSLIKLSLPCGRHVSLAQ